MEADHFPLPPHNIRRCSRPRPVSAQRGRPRPCDAWPLPSFSGRFKGNGRLAIVPIVLAALAIFDVA